MQSKTPVWTRESRQLLKTKPEQPTQKGGRGMFVVLSIVSIQDES